MRFENKDTEMFMYLVRTFVADKHTYLLKTDEHYKFNPEKTLLGYYDTEYVYGNRTEKKVPLHRE